MNLLHRIRYVLGLGSAPKSSRWWPIGLLAMILPLGVLTASLLMPPGQPVVLAQDDRDDEERRGSEADRRQAQLKRAFGAYDKNKDGKVTAEEFMAVLGGKDNPKVRAVAARQFSAADRNGDKSVSFEEFLVAGKHKPKGGKRRGRRDGERPREAADLRDKR